MVFSFVLSSLKPMNDTYFPPFDDLNGKSRKENPQKLTQLSSRSHPRHLVGKKGQHKKTPS